MRSADRRMSTEVAEAVAATVNVWAAGRDRFSVVWHGGEPMAGGREHLAALMAPFRGVEHHIQTNATLIDDRWCEFFGSHDIRVGVSVDGPGAYSDQRTDWRGVSAYPRIMEGIAQLRRHGIAFAALCVVSDPRPELAAQLYAFFQGLGCYALGINIEEREGINTRDNHHDELAVRGFWAALTAAWRADPSIELRDVEWAIRYAAQLQRDTADELLPRRVDPIPTVTHDGQVVLISPELAGFTHPAYGDFASGSVLSEPLHAILERVARHPTGWIADYQEGVEACRTTCAYFGYCGGGHAANRLFEHGRFNTTETEHCRNSKIYLMEGVLDHASGATA